MSAGTSCSVKDLEAGDLFVPGCSDSLCLALVWKDEYEGDHPDIDWRCLVIWEISYNRLRYIRLRHRDNLTLPTKLIARYAQI